ncbi:MBL fold metallo-hydrolase [Staphylococcus caprae]|nr:MBL fold metallo-hydrolase [Staphylococcus caprae]QDW94828.1 MBL fold metallo-hydrolase [Staphylococcus caprae]
MLEAGIKFDKVQKHFKGRTRKIKGCLITHEHGDHAQYVKQYLSEGINCYVTLGTHNSINIESHRIYNIKSKQEIRIGTWSILPFDIDHDANEPVGFLLQSVHGYKVLYVTDTKYLKYKFKGLTHMMLEVNYIYEQMQQNIKDGIVHNALANRIMQSHFSLENAIGLLKANDLSKLQEIHLIHLSNNNSNATHIKNSIQETTGVPVYIGGL